MKLLALLLVAISGMFYGCESTQSHDKALHNEQLQAVTIEDGINQQEADVIARCYFSRFVSGCGATAPVIDGGQCWIAKTFVGYAGIPGEIIKIDKQTGQVTSKGHPTIDNPKTIFD